MAFVVLAGAWLGFWVVHKLVLTEDGSIDISTSNFVAWSIRILAVIMILQVAFPPVIILSFLLMHGMKYGFPCLQTESKYLLFQSSLDPLLAAEALISGIFVSSILRKLARLRFLRRVFK